MRSIRTVRVRAERLITRALREKEVLLREIHHWVKNNLQVISSLLRLQSQHVKDPASLELFREGQSRVHSMALVHERLYHSADLARIDFSRYLQELAAFLFSAYQATAGTVSPKVDVDDVDLDMDAAINYGLIVSELISHALKHAFPGNRGGEVRISLRRQGEHNELVVADDGVGFPEAIDPLKTESLGLQLVTMLVQECQGTIEVQQGAGTTAKLRFPVRQPPNLDPDERSPDGARDKAAG